MIVVKIMHKCIKIIRILFYIHQASQISVHQLNNILQTSSYSQSPASVHHSPYVDTPLYIYCQKEWFQPLSSIACN